ncbi:small glutamine-rich tetratricopeptide repeat-containing protein isoform X1 [Triticum urartu]|uniref:Small glutamine-rich tetratricopeptide repeat-containing protein alpha n=1 Tax=Triticum urartu TaxID=4572 RepID=A0A8R7TPJ0_TRIUA|nr:small glutamine-rich tetratricopeptide repeat-containing protein isoform X1 [Triticum urartu]
MGNMTRSDSPVSRRIVLSFLDFLNSVELAPGADPEALEVAKDCLESLFSINSSSTSERIQPGLLLELFTSLQANEQDRARPDPVSRSVSNKPSCSASTSSIQEESNKCTTSNSEGQAEETFDLDHAGDELFAKFFAALDEINFFKTSPAGAEDPDQLSKASQFFDDALLEVRKSGRKVASLVDLAEFFKSKGNDFMRSKQHLKAVELYTGAIALSQKNAIYYCNRAAAYTLLNMCNEAVEDCLKSIEIDPNYSKAYSRLGSAYFAMGNFHDALHKGYLKASELEPGNENVRLNIEATKRKLAEQRAAPGQNPHGPHSWFGGQASSGAPFTVFPPGSAPPPPEFFNMMNRGSGNGQQPPPHSVNINLNDFFGHANVNGNAQGPPSGNPGTHTPSAPFPASAGVPPAFPFMGSGTEANHAQQASGGHGGGHSEPGAQTDAGIHINIGESMVSPEQAAEALRAVMQMFGPQMGPNEGGGAPRGPPPPPGSI